MNRTKAYISCAMLAAILFFFSGCTKEEKPAALPALTLMTHDSFKVTEKVVKDFEQAYECKVTILKSGDAGAALNQAILSKKNPLADIFYGVDNTFMGRALKEDLGLAFMLVSIGHFGEDAYLEFWKKLKSNGLLVTGGWEDAYWGQFSAASKGTRPIVVSYATSPPAEVYFSKKPLDEPPTAAVVAPGTTFRQVEFVGIIRGTKQPELARKWVDYMLSVPFQEDIPLQMFMFPANSKAGLPDVFRKHAVVSREPVTVDPERISENREVWIEAWTDAVLR